MSKEKKQILEAVQNQDSFKTAVDILQKYGHYSVLCTEIRKTDSKFCLSKETNFTPISNFSTQLVPDNTQFVIETTANNDSSLNTYPVSSLQSGKNHSLFERAIDFIVGENIHNYSDVICKQCFHHNGVVSKTDFNYIAYQCSFCGHFNSAIKRKLKSPCIAVFKDELQQSSTDSEASNGLQFTKGLSRNIHKIKDDEG